MPAAVATRASSGSVIFQFLRANGLAGRMTDVRRPRQGDAGQCRPLPVLYREVSGFDVSELVSSPAVVATMEAPLPDIIREAVSLSSSRILRLAIPVTVAAAVSALMLRGLSPPRRAPSPAELGFPVVLNCGHGRLAPSRCRTRRPSAGFSLLDVPLHVCLRRPASRGAAAGANHAAISQTVTSRAPV